MASKTQKHTTHRQDPDHPILSSPLKLINDEAVGKLCLFTVLTPEARTVKHITIVNDNRKW
jgi:hypothetical protein